MKSGPGRFCDYDSDPGAGGPDSRARLPVKFRMSVCGICLQSFHDVDPDKFQVASLDSCNHRFCLKCIQCWAKIKTSCPSCRTPFKYVDSSTGKRFECKAKVPTPSASESEPEESLSDDDSEILGVAENSDQYVSDDGFVVHDNVIQYDTDYESDLQDYERSEELIDLSIERYTIAHSNQRPEMHENQDGSVGPKRKPRHLNAPQFKSAIERLEEMRSKRRKTKSCFDNSHPQHRGNIQSASASVHGSKFFQSNKNDRLPAATAGEGRPEKRSLSRIKQACSDSDSEDVRGASTSGIRSTSDAAVADGIGMKQGGWLSRLKAHVKAPALSQPKSSKP